MMCDEEMGALFADRGLITHPWNYELNLLIADKTKFLRINSASSPPCHALPPPSLSKLLSSPPTISSL